MSYTVKELAQLSGVSVRTLHWYDEIGLLKPAYHGANGYRYYEEEQMLLLQQVLFFRELGFKLDDIQTVLGKSDFDTIRALKIHRHSLEQNLDRTKRLIKTIDQTMKHLRGKQKMDTAHLYDGFDPEKQKDYEQYLVKHHGTVAEDLLFESQRRTAKWGSDEWQQVKEEGEAIYQAAADLLKQGKGPRDEQMQALIEQHCQMLGRFYDVSKDVYVGLSQLYTEHPDFRKFFDRVHPELVQFFAEAMRVYAHQNLK